MSKSFLFVALLVSLAASACSTPSLQPRLEELEREREDLTRQNMELRGNLTACQAKCSALEHSIKDRPVSGARSFALPSDLTSQGIQLKKNGFGETVIDIPSDVFFSSGVSSLTKKGEQTLERVAELIQKNYPGSLLRVEGHADSDPISRTDPRSRPTSDRYSPAVRCV